MVYILDINGNPLAPTEHHGKVKHLLKSDKAQVVKDDPFTIRLLYETPHHISVSDNNRIVVNGKEMDEVITILNSKGNPIRPCSNHSRIRSLIVSNNANIVSTDPFTVQLLYDTPNKVEISQKTGRITVDGKDTDQLIYMTNIKNESITPTKNHIRIFSLLLEYKARIVSYNPFTVQLLYPTPNHDPNLNKK